MLPSEGLLVPFVLLWLLASDAKCQNLQDMSETLNGMLADTRTFRRPRDYEDTSLIWQEYEFGTGAGNREEVVVTNISSYDFLNTPDDSNQQFLLTKTGHYFVHTEYSILRIYEIHWDDPETISHVTNIETDGRILQFRIVELNAEETGNENGVGDLLAVVVVERNYTKLLYWYRIFGNTHLLYLKWHRIRYFSDVELAQTEGQHAILLLDDSDWTRSWIDIYSFKVDPSKHSIDIWFCENSYVPKTLDIQVCPIYGSTILGLQQRGHIDVYKFENGDKSCHLERQDTIRPMNLTNFVCFASGYIEYLAISGRESRLLHSFENEFQHNTDLRSEVSDAEISWITALPLDTYREESLLLMQLANRTVIALTWQGSRFKRVPLPNEIMSSFDLSKMIVIPKIGFLHKNVYIRVRTSLRASAHPIYEKTESMLKTQALLEDVFQKQEAIFDETEARLKQNHLIPMTAWNLSEVIVSNATFDKDVNYGRVTVGSVDLGAEDIMTNLTSSLERLKRLERALDEILPNLTDASNVTLSLDVELNGDLLVNGTVHAKKVTVAAINNATASIAIADDIANNAGDLVIHGRKSFPSIDIASFTVASLNGIPLEEIAFDTSPRDYSGVDFARLKRLEVKGHLNFSEINNVNWQDLMASVVWKDRQTVIPGQTIVDEIVAEDENSVENLNDLPYPRDYVVLDWTNSRLEANITGKKYFGKLSVKDLVNVSTINDINIADFIILSRHEVINEEITFEDLEVDGTLLLDGNITGIDLSRMEGLLNETNVMSSNVIFENLNVTGNIVFEDSINTKTWSDFNDILLRSEKSAVITGNKEFLNNVNVGSNVTIELDEINGHAISEFVTVNSDQQLPHLSRFSGNVSFGNVTLGVVQKLEDHITREYLVTSNCLHTVVVFDDVPPLVDDLHFDTLMQNIPRAAFLDKLNQSLRDVHCWTLSPSELIADQVLPHMINRIDYADLVQGTLTASTKQTLTGELTADELETEILDAETINGMPLDELRRVLTRATLLDADLPIKIGSLRVSGEISVSSINGIDVHDIYEEDSMGTVIFRENVSIDNLTLTGLVNGFDLSRVADDAVRKTDRDVTFTGRKVFEKLTCDYLDTRFVNDHSVDDILNTEEEQTLKGPVTVTGSVTVLRDFDTAGRIGGVSLGDFAKRSQSLGNSSYVLRGDFYFTEIAAVRNLNVNGSIQQSAFDDFLATTISNDDANVTMLGRKLFNNSVTFDREFIIDGTLNDIDLRRFRESAIYIDKPLAMNSDVVFSEAVHVRKDVVVKTKLQSGTVWGVDLSELHESVVALDEVRYFPARMTLGNATFRESVEVERVNDLQMDLLITLSTKQFIPVDGLRCTNITAGDFQILGRINGHTLDDIYGDTFTIFGDQNVTGNTTIRGNVYASHDFNAHLINNFNPKRIVSLTANDTLNGNFMFKNPVVLDKSLRILGALNGINPINWHGTAVKTSGQTRQIISGRWRVHGNVHFESDVSGDELLNGVNVAEMSAALAEESASIDRIIAGTYRNLTDVCASYLKPLMCDAARQIYKFDRFDYSKVLDLDGDVHDIRKVESDNLDYVLVNYGTCRLKLLLHSELGFKETDEISDFGLIDRWIFLKSNRSLHLLTIANRSCGKGLNNIWKLENDKLTHVSDFGKVDDIIHLYQDAFSGVTRESLEDALGNVRSNMSEIPVSHDNETRMNLISDSNAPPDQSLIHEMQGKSRDTYQKDFIASGRRLSFKVGIYNKEEYLYYNENISREYIYLYKAQEGNNSQAKILQTIKTCRPTSFLVLNFSGSVETLLIIAENNDAIQIYEYRGIEGFVHKDTVKMKIDKLYSFKIRKYTNLDERHCLAVTHENRLTILEAKMHGEKLDLTALSGVSQFCYPDTCAKH